MSHSARETHAHVSQCCGFRAKRARVVLGEKITIFAKIMWRTQQTESQTLDRNWKGKDCSFRRCKLFCVILFQRLRVVDCITAKYVNKLLYSNFNLHLWCKPVTSDFHGRLTQSRLPCQSHVVFVRHKLARWRDPMSNCERAERLKNCYDSNL